MIGFCTSGGGANGAFEVGVMNQLDKKGIKADVILGTSTGAFNAIGYGYQGLPFLTNEWKSIKGEGDVFTSRGLLIPFYLFFGNGKGCYSADPLKAKVDKTVIGSPSIKTGVCVTSLRTTASIYNWTLPSTSFLTPTNTEVIKMRKYALASGMTPVYNDVIDDELVDGGLRNIAPLGELINQGCDEIYVILAEQFQQNQAPNYKGKVGNVLSVAGYTINAMVQGVLWNDVKMVQKINDILDLTTVPNGYKKIKIHVYAPMKDLGSSTDFTPARLASIMSYGETIAPVI
jgi:NTE family protein